MATRALVLGVASCAVLGLAKAHGPQGPLAGSVYDALAMPGAVLLFPLFPQGPDSNIRFEYWGHAVVLANVILYSGAWYVTLRWVRRRKTGRSAAGEIDDPQRSATRSSRG